MSNTQRSVMRKISKIWMPLCLKKIFRAPARPTFVNSDKSRQKHRKEPPVPSLPSALCSVRTCDCIPHVHVKFPFSLRCRIVSAPAPLPLIPTPNNAFGSTVESMSGSGARRKSIRRGVKKTCRWHVFSLRSRRLCRRSIHLIFEGTTSPRHTIGAQCPFPHQSAAATREQRRFDNDATTRILRERAAGSPDSVQRAARREVKEPEVPSGVFAYFCHC